MHVAASPPPSRRGRAALAVKLADTRDAVAAGADEIDMVIDRGAFLSGHYLEVFDEIVAVKEACGDGAHLKVILETGELSPTTTCAAPPGSAMLAGADFIKTSTGKIAAGGDPAGDAGDARGGPRLPRRRPAGRSA